MHLLLHSVPPTLQQATTNPQLHRRLSDTHRQVQDSLLWGHCSFFFWALVYRVLLFPPWVYFPVRVNSGSSVAGLMATSSRQEGLCHTQVCCTQSLCPCSRPPPTCTFTGDIQTLCVLSLCGNSGSWCVQGWFEPSDRLWWEWGLILNVNLPLLSSCWGLSFALGLGASPHRRTSAYHLSGISLTLDVGYLHTASPVKRSHHAWPCTWDICSQLLLLIKLPYDPVDPLLGICPEKIIIKKIHIF